MPPPVAVQLTFAASVEPSWRVAIALNNWDSPVNTLAELGEMLMLTIGDVGTTMLTEADLVIEPPTRLAVTLKLPGVLPGV